MLLFSCPFMPDSLRPHGLKHSRLSCSSPSPKVCPSSCPLYRLCHPTVSFFGALFSFCPQSFPASENFPMSWPLSDDQNTGASASISVLPMYSVLISLNIDWFNIFAVQGNLRSPPAPQFQGINFLALCLLYSPGLTTLGDP